MKAFKVHPKLELEISAVDNAEVQENAWHPRNTILEKISTDAN